MRLPEYNGGAGYQNPNVPGPRLDPGAGRVQTNAAMFGAQNGQDLQRLGQQIQQTASRAAYIFDDYNSTKAQAASNTLQQEFLTWQGEANKRKGVDAENTAADYDKWSKDRMAVLSKGMNQVQFGRFQAMAVERQVPQQRWARDYGEEQKRTYQISEWQAGINIEAGTVAANIGDPEMVAGALERGKDYAFNIAKMQGMDEKATMRMMRDASEKLLVPAINARIQDGQTGTYPKRLQICQRRQGNVLEILWIEVHVVAYKKRRFWLLGYQEFHFGI